MINAVQVAWDDRDCGQKHNGEAAAARKPPSPGQRTAKLPSATGGPDRSAPGRGNPPPPGPVLSSRKKTKPQEAVRAPFPLGTRSCAEGTCPGFCANAGRLLDGVPSQE